MRLMGGLLAIVAIGLLGSLIDQAQAESILRTYRSGVHMLSGTSKWMALAIDAGVIFAILAVAFSVLRKRKTQHDDHQGS